MRAHVHEVCPCARICGTVRQQQTDLNSNLQPWLTSQGLARAPVGGDQLNCLINSIIQGATGQYDKQTFAEADAIRRGVIAHDPSATHMLTFDIHASKILELVNLARLPACTHARTHARTRAHTRARAHTHTRTCTHARTHACAHTEIRHEHQRPF